MDAHVPALRCVKAGLFDAIITDPPYGVRAGGRRSLCLSETGSASKEGQQRAQVSADIPEGPEPLQLLCLLTALALFKSSSDVRSRLRRRLM